MEKINQPKLTSGLKKLSLLFSIIVVSIGFIVLIGWICSIPIFKSISPRWISMKANTAICFILAGLTLIILNREKTDTLSKNIVPLFSVIIILTGVITILQYVFQFNAGIDEFFFKDNIVAEGTAHPGRLSPITAVCFMLFGFSFLFSNFRKYNWLIFQCFYLVAGIISFFALVSYIFGAKQIIGISEYTAIAFHTSLSFVILMLAVMFSRPERGIMKLISSPDSGGRVFRNTFPAILAIIIIIGWLLFKGEQKGLYDFHIGVPVYIIAVVIVFGIILFFNTIRLSRSDERLKKSEGHLHTIFANSSVGLILLDTHCTILELNNRTKYFNSISFGRELRKGENLLLSVPGYRREELQKKFEQTLQGKRINFESVYPQGDGSIITFNVNLNPVIGADGEVTGACLTFENITERKKAEQKITESEERYRSIMEQASDAIFLNDISGNILEVNTRACRLLGYKADELCDKHISDLYSPEELLLRPIMYKELKAGKRTFLERNILHSSGVEIPVEITGQMLSDGRIMAIARDITRRKQATEKILKSEEQYRDLVDNISDLICTHDLEGNILSVNRAAEKLTGFKFSPHQRMNIKDLLSSNVNGEFDHYMSSIKTNGFGHGLMKIKTLTGEIRIWEYNNSLKATGPGTAIVRGYARDITEQKKAEKEMKKSEEKFRSFFDQSADAIFIFDETGRFLDVNNVSSNLLGYSKRDFIKISLHDIVFKEDLVANPIGLDLLIAGNPVIRQRRLKRKDGAAVEVEVHSKKLPDGTYLGVVRDITERKKAEEKLRQLSQAVEQSPASVVITDLQGNIQYVNQKFIDVTGYAQEEVIGKTPRILKSGHTSDIEYKNLWKNISSGLEWKGELHNKKKNGELYWESAWISPIINRKGEIINFLAIKEDITERKKAEAELLRSHDQFQNLVESISGAYWVTDLSNNRTIYVSPSFELISGRKPEELYQDQSIFINAVHPEDREQLLEIYEKVNGTNKLSFSYRFVRPDGTIRWISAKSSILTDSNGHKMEYGYAEDITDRKQAEEALNESEETFRRLFDESADPVLLLDESGFVDCNQSTVSILGFASKHEVINKKPWEISPEMQPDGKPSMYKAKAMIAKALELGYNRFEWIHTRSDRTEFPVEVMLTPIILGGKQFFYTVWRDITERKKAEREKQTAYERYDILAQATSDTIWDWDIVNNKMLYNDGINKMFGYQASEVENVIDWWNEKVHPDDFQKINELLDDIFEKGMEKFQLAYRFRSADGSYKHIFDRAFVIFDENHKPCRMIGAMQDITHQVEEEMRISKAIIDAHEEERRFIGEELHDNVNQILAGSLLSLGMAKTTVHDTEKASEFIEMTKGCIGSAIDEIRKLSHQLVPPTSVENSLKEIFEDLLSNINLDGRFAICLHFDEFDDTDVPDNVQINLYRILQEQVKNILKYSEADAIKVAITLSGNAVTMRVSDNGKGFDPKAKKKGIGLSNIKKRAESLSGKFILNSTPGKGCEIIVAIPLASSLVHQD